MKLVIDISHNLFESLIKGYELSYLGESEIRKALINAKPLPEHHGDLFDKNEITAFAELECNGHDVKSLDEFTTIIPATKEGDGE